MGRILIITKKKKVLCSKFQGFRVPGFPVKVFQGVQGVYGV